MEMQFKNWITIPEVLLSDVVIVKVKVSTLPLTRILMNKDVNTMCHGSTFP